jgi:hypothetical protein
MKNLAILMVEILLILLLVGPAMLMMVTNKKIYDSTGKG